MTTNEPIDLVAFGQRLRMLREAAGLNQGDVGKQLGVERSTISGWELANDRDAEHVRGPGSHSLLQAAKLFDVCPFWLLYGKGRRYDGTGQFLDAECMIEQKNVRAIMSSKRRGDLAKLKFRRIIALLDDGQWEARVGVPFTATSDFVDRKTFDATVERCVRHLQKIARLR